LSYERFVKPRFLKQCTEETRDGQHRQWHPARARLAGRRRVQGGLDGGRHVHHRRRGRAEFLRQR
jgi:hypothetical protein